MTSQTIPPSSEQKKEEPPASHGPSLKVALARGNVTNVRTPAVVVGSYKGIAPVSALKALDDALDHWVTRAGDQGMIGGELGEVLFIPVMNKEINARSVLLAGMGEYGRFDYDDLRYLSMNVCYAVSAIKMRRFATVLIGSGDGSLDIEDAIKGMLSGFCDALHRVDPKERVAEVVMVEENRERYSRMREILKDFEKKQSIENIQLTFSEEVIRGKKGKESKEEEATPTRRMPISKFVNRITIERSEDGYSFSALTNNAVVPMREVNVQTFFSEGIAEELRQGQDPASHERFGSLLHNYIFPEDFDDMISDGRSLTLIVDKDTAALPWEMACYGRRNSRRYFGTDLRLTRQFRTMLSGSPGIPPPINKTLRILVIGDPASDYEGLELEGASREAKQVVEILEKCREELRGELEIQIVSRIGTKQCKPLEILALMNEPFDVVHYSGHGTFESKKPNLGGWVLSRKVTLTAREIFRTRQVPRVVFANACFSAVTAGAGAPSTEETNRKLAGFAQAFFARGVQNYIGTGWKVEDDAAVRFAQVFYEKAMAGDLLGDALAAARREIFDLGSTWGAYQHYGQSSVRIV